MFIRIRNIKYMCAITQSKLSVTPAVCAQQHDLFVAVQLVID